MYLHAHFSLMINVGGARVGILPGFCHKDYRLNLHGDHLATFLIKRIFFLSLSHKFLSWVARVGWRKASLTLSPWIPRSSRTVPSDVAGHTRGVPRADWEVAKSLSRNLRLSARLILTRAFYIPIWLFVLLPRSLLPWQRYKFTLVFYRIIE